MIYHGTDGDHYYPPELHSSKPLLMSGAIDDDNAALGYELGLSECNNVYPDYLYPVALNGMRDAPTPPRSSVLKAVLLGAAVGAGVGYMVGGSPKSGAAAGAVISGLMQYGWMV